VRLPWLSWAGWLLLVVALGMGLAYLLPLRQGEPGPSPAVMVRQPEKIPDEVVVCAGPQKPESTPVLLPTTAVPLSCFYHFDRFRSTLPLQVTWRLGAQGLGPVPLEGKKTEGGGALGGQFLLRPPGNAPQWAPGIYQLTFHSGTEELVESSFVVGVDADRLLTQQAPPAGEIRVISLLTCAGLDAQGQPLGIAQQFRPTDKIFAVFTYLNGVKTARFAVRWLAQGEVIPQAAQQVEMRAGAGHAYTWLQASGPGLPEGECEVQVLVAGNDEPLAEGTFTVSPAAPPPGTAPSPAPAPVVPALPRLGR
jgi:hypothetical protein